MDNALQPGTCVQYPPVGRVTKDLHLAKFLLEQCCRTVDTFSVRKYATGRTNIVLAMDRTPYDSVSLFLSGSFCFDIEGVSHVV